MKEKSWLPRKPAHVLLRYMLPKLEVAPPEIAEQLCRAIRLTCDKVWVYKTDFVFPLGYFRIDFSNGSSSIFIKIISKQYVDQQVEADVVAKYLHREGVTANGLLSEYPKRLDEDHYVLAYPYIRGRYAEHTEEDLTQVGTALAKMHKAFTKLPNSEAIKNTSLDRLSLLQSRQKLIIEGRCAINKKSGWLGKLLLEAGQENFCLPEESCQVLHGDFHHGNLFFPTDSPLPVILDLEDSLISWGPIRWDIALALERFAISEAINDQQALLLSQALLDAYLEYGGENPFKRSGDLAKTLFWLSLRNLVLLAEAEAIGKPLPESEKAKFYQLIDQVAKKNTLLKKIEEYCIQK
jgi:thiamine kinase-like enzyme